MMVLLAGIATAIVAGFWLFDPSDDRPATPAPPTLTALWRGGFESGDFAQYADAPWNFEGAGLPSIVDEPAKFGTYAARFAIPPGARRQELVAMKPDGEPFKFQEGDELYFRFSTRFGNWPTVNTWQLIAQWKADGAGSPPVAMLAGAWGRDRIQMAAAGWPGGGSREVHDLGPLVRDEWIDWVVRIDFSSDPGRSRVVVWRDGALVLDAPEWRPSFEGEEAGKAGGTLRREAESYLKMGIYRNPEITQVGEYWADGWAIAREAGGR